MLVMVRLMAMVTDEDKVVVEDEAVREDEAVVEDEAVRDDKAVGELMTLLLELMMVVKPVVVGLVMVVLVMVD